MEPTPQAQEEQLRRAFERAVALERKAIAVHERAALLHDEAASLFEGAAVAARMPQQHVAELVGRAASERKHASDARARARTARARLAAEGQDAPAVTAAT